MAAASRWSVRLVIAAVAATWMPSASACEALVTFVVPGREAGRLGFRTGDCVVAVEIGGVRKDVASPLDVFGAEYGAAAAGNVELVRRRGPSESKIAMATGYWGLELLPGLASASTTRLLEWRAAMATGRSADWPAAVEAGISPSQRVALQWWRTDVLAVQASPLSPDVLDDAVLVAGGIAQAHAATVAMHRCALAVEIWRGKAAASQCTDAATLAEAADLPLQRARALTEAAAITADTREFELGMSWLSQAEALLDVEAPESMPRAYAYFIRARLLRMQEHFSEAMTELAKSARLLERLHSAERLRISVLSLEGLIERARGNLDAARDRLGEAMALSSRSQPGTIAHSRMLNNLALVQWDRMDMQAAVRSLEESIAIKRERGAGASETAGSLLNLAMVELPLEREAEVLENAKAAEALLRGANDRLNLASALELLARISSSQGDIALADARFAESLAIIGELQPGTVLEGWTRLFHAQHLQRKQSLPAAVAEARIAVDMFRRASNEGRDLALGLSQFGQLLMTTSDFAQADRVLGEALVLLRRQSPASRRLAEAMHRAGSARAALGDPEGARQLYCEAVETLEQQRWRWSSEPRDRLAWASDSAQIYRDCALALLHAQRGAEAFDVLERSRGRVLLDRLTGDRRELVDALPASVRSLWRELDAIEKSAGQADAPRREELRRRLAAASPAQAATLLAQPLQFAQISRRLAPDTLAWSLFVHGSEAWVVTFRRDDQAPSFRRLPIDAQALDRLSARVTRAALGSPSSAGAEDSRALYDLFFGGLGEAFDAAPRLLLVPDTSVILLPFAALVDARGRYLVEHHASRQSTSFSSAAIESPAPAPGSPVLLVSMPQAVELAASSRRNAAVSLPALPGAAAELERLSALYGDRSVQLSGAAATERAVLGAMREAGQIHFAAHGVLDAREPLESALILASSGALAGEDGRLTARELVQGPRLRASFVGLSACDLGAGQSIDGEGLFGLRHVLRAIGVPHVLSSVWSVSDAASLRLMPDFHRRLRDGVPVDLALQAAQVAFLRAEPVPESSAVRGVGGVRPTGSNARGPAPFLWAGFVADGTLD